MQTTIYYNREDAYLIDQLDMKGRHERKSRSAVILSILEEYFESDKRIGEILIDMGAIPYAGLVRALELQKESAGEKKLGQILLEQEMLDHGVLERALLVQGRNSQKDRMASVAL